MYHVNPESGEPGTCKAMKSCPFGGADVHYTSPEAARAAYENSQTGAFSSPKPARIKRVPTPKTKSEFAEAILQVIPKVEDSKVVPMPTTNIKEANGATRYIGGSVSTKDAIADARAAGEIQSWITTTVKNDTYHWTSPALAVTLGFKGANGKGAIPSDWLDKSGDRPQSEAGVRLALYMEQMARQFESSYSNLAVDERTVSNRGKVAWL
jgi:hypothetical protein